jgi:formamidopyrimidine-DNA glycosylase
MPELPEVETTVQDLKKVLPGLKIRDVWSDLPRRQTGVFDAEKIRKEIAGKKILKIERKGKNILIHLSGDKTILIHQKLTGHLLYGLKNRFIHLILFLSNGKQLALSDSRKFAKVAVLATEKISEEFKNLGPDPIDKNFTFKKFSMRIARLRPSGSGNANGHMRIKKSRPIKQVLMDQNVIAGIGNIYSDEILWKAGAHPLKEVQKLKEKDLKNIYQAIKTVLKKAIYQKIQNVYQMAGQKCKKKDGGIIKRIKIGGRSAHFCPFHQKL